MGKSQCGLLVTLQRNPALSGSNAPLLKQNPLRRGCHVAPAFFRALRARRHTAQRDLQQPLCLLKTAFHHPAKSKDAISNRPVFPRCFPFALQKSQGYKRTTNQPHTHKPTTVKKNNNMSPTLGTTYCCGSSCQAPDAGLAAGDEILSPPFCNNHTPPTWKEGGPL